MIFTAHNIVLDDGTQTRPQSGIPTSDDHRCIAALHTLRKAFDGRLASSVRIADLGCLEGGYSVEFARAGFEVAGIEVRQSNYARCQYVRERIDLPNLSFVHDNVWNLLQHGSFDAIFCCGILYHLDRPRAFLSLMNQACRHVAIVNTHFSIEGPGDAYSQSDVTSHEGLRGRWYPEIDSTDLAVREAASWASWENPRSFWPLRNDLIAAAKTAGFSQIIEHPGESQPQRIHFDAFK
jgi:SAM-dependent methyltransferase